MRKTRRDKGKIIVSGTGGDIDSYSDFLTLWSDSSYTDSYMADMNAFDEYLKLDEIRLTIDTVKKFLDNSTYGAFVPKMGVTERYGIPDIIQVHSEDPLDETLIMNHTDTLRLDGENAGRPIFKVIDSEKFKIIKPELEKLGELKVLKFK